MKLSRKLYLPVIVFLIIIVVIYFNTNNRPQQVSTQNNVAALWNKEITDRYNDEPEIKTIALNNLKISSSSSWAVPADPNIITTDPILKYPVDREFADENALTESDWNEHPYFKEMLDKQNLDKKYYDYFIKSGNVPAPNLTTTVDVNGDGSNDKIFQSRGLGCASCHLNYIDIFIGDKRYEARTNEGGIYPRSDHKGFYITNAFTGKDYATCCPDNYVISKYEWNGGGFTEVARKAIWVVKNKP